MANAAHHVSSRWLAAVFALAAGVSMVLLTRVVTIAYAPQKPLYYIAGIILLVAALGALVPVAEPWAQVLLWNGTGWSIGLAVLGLESVGAMPIWPIMLAALSLTFWPRDDDNRISAATIAIALVGGFLVCWLGWAEPEIHLPAWLILE